MIDEIFDRAYQERRMEMNAALSAGLDALSRATRKAFMVLNRIEYDAPWRGASPKARAN